MDKKTNKKITKKEAIKKISESPELLNAAITALNAGKISTFLKENGVDATEAEAKKFLQSKNGELGLNELNKVAGGIIVEETHC